jgi:hypothetical protein
MIARVLLCACLLLAPTMGQLYTWVGGTMAFDQPYNWEGNFVPDNSSAIPCATKFGASTRNIVSTLSVSPPPPPRLIC